MLLKKGTLLKDNITNPIVSEARGILDEAGFSADNIEYYTERLIDILDDYSLLLFAILQKPWYAYSASQNRHMPYQEIERVFCTNGPPLGNPYIYWKNQPFSLDIKAITSQ